MNIVLDTNVLVSGLLTPFGPSAEIVRMVFSGDLIALVDARIVSEYREVLHRPKFNYNKEHIAIVIDFFKSAGEMVSSLPLKKRLPDPDDAPFLEVAIAGHAKGLITGNKAHFPPAAAKGVKILSPSQFLEIFRRQDRIAP